jgi:hypothetical protein
MRKGTIELWINTFSYNHFINFRDWKIVSLLLMSVLLNSYVFLLVKFYLLDCHWYAGLLEKRKNSSDGLSPPQPKKGILIVDDEPEKEPPPKCCS